MATKLNGNWISFGDAIKAKINIRISSLNSDADLNEILSKRKNIDGNSKLKASKIYSDNSSNQIFNTSGDLKNTVKIEGETESIHSLYIREKNKANSMSQLYIDSTLCKNDNCLFSVMRFVLPIDTGSLINPFANDTGIALLYSDGAFNVEIRNEDLYNKFENIPTLYDVVPSEKERFAYLFAKEICKDFFHTKTDYSYTVNMNEPSLTKVYSYIYVNSSFIITNYDNTNAVTITQEFRNVCVHVSGVSGACSGEKIDETLPKSSVFRNTTGIPTLLRNCDPFGCMMDFENDTYVTTRVPSCLPKCPFGAIKYKMTDTIIQPIDTDDIIKAISTIGFVEKPFA